MPRVLHYGTDSQLRFEPPAETELHACGTPPGEPLDDVSAAVAAALVEPLEFPPLAEATVPGDRVVIALERHLPRAAEVVAGLVESLLAAHSRPEEITILITPEQQADASGDPRGGLPTELAERIALEIHDPGNRDRLGFIAPSKEGKAIYVNRAVADADLVIPVGCLRLDEAIGYHGIHGGLFPGFADEETQARFRAPSIDDVQVTRRRRRDEAEEAAWKLGAIFTLQVIPAGADGVLQVFAGDARAVRKRGSELCDAAWRWRVPRRASLVVAALSGDAASQTWENAGRALAAARHAVEDGGAIALCCELADRPGPALQRLLGERSEEGHSLALREIRKQKTADAASAAQIAMALDQAKVFLLSRLDEDLVYELGMAAVEDPEDLGRLIQRHPSCILLENAQFAMVATDEDQS